MNACKPHTVPAPSLVNIQREKISLSPSMIENLPPLFREVAYLLKERGAIEIREGG